MPELKKVSLAKIHIPEVRVSSILDEEQKALMASTIQQIGLVQDIVVRPISQDEYELVAGKSRLEELGRQGMTETQVKVISADEKLGLIMNIVENVARGSFDYISIAKSIRKLRSMGTSLEELEQIFPWKKRWIEFIEDLQDMPDDVTAAVAARKITPTHIMYALNLSTPYEVHDALRTAINLEWDSGTLKTFVQNRLEQIERAKKEAEAKGGPVEVPPAMPAELIKYRQCLLCGYKKPIETTTVQIVCDPCRELVSYITNQLGPAEEAVQTLYAALQLYFGVLQAKKGPEPTATPGSSQP